jgi:hypothetical protein
VVGPYARSWCRQSLMANIFLSYKSERRKVAEHLSRVIALHGYSVWFDIALITGRDFARQIDRELRAAKCTLVLWCSRSVSSEWVLEEAELAKRLGTLIPVWIEKVDLPLGFQRTDTIDLTSWDGSPKSRTLDRLLDQIRRRSTSQKPDYDGLREYEQTWRRFGSPRPADFGLVEPLPEEQHELGLTIDGSKPWKRVARNAILAAGGAGAVAAGAFALLSSHSHFGPISPAGASSGLDGSIVSRNVEPPSKPTATITSHSDGATVSGNRENQPPAVTQRSEPPSANRARTGVKAAEAANHQVPVDAKNGTRRRLAAGINNASVDRQLDTDLDGIPDYLDKCPYEQEKFNRYRDADGCPDAVPESIGYLIRSVVEDTAFEETGVLSEYGRTTLCADWATRMKDTPDAGLVVTTSCDGILGEEGHQRNAGILSCLLARGIKRNRLRTKSELGHNCKTKFFVFTPSESED